MRPSAGSRSGSAAAWPDACGAAAPGAPPGPAVQPRAGEGAAGREREESGRGTEIRGAGVAVLLLPGAGRASRATPPAPSPVPPVPPVPAFAAEVQPKLTEAM